MQIDQRHLWLFMLCTVALAARAAGHWPRVPTPPRAQLEWVARDAVVNGLPARIERFETELSTSEVLAFYRQKWAGAATGSARAVAGGGWQALSTLDGGFQITVQVRARSPSGSEGLISTMNFRGMHKEIAPAELPRFPDTRISQVTESFDGPQRSRLVNMVSTQSFELNMQRWRGEWLQRGWQIAFEKVAPVGRDGVKTWIASFSKPPHSVDLALAWRPSDQRSYLTANLMGPAEGARP